MIFRLRPRSATSQATPSPDTLREHYAAKRPSEADIEPVRERLAATIRRRKAMHAERELRKLDELRASEEAKRQAALEAMAE